MENEHQETGYQDPLTADEQTPGNPTQQKPGLPMGCLLPLIVVIAAILIAVYLVKSKPKEEAPVAAEKTWNVQVKQVNPSLNTPQLSLFGVIEAPQSARLSAAIAADVVAVPVRDGQQVAAGDLLVQLDAVEAQIVLDRAEADLALEDARQKADRQFLARERELLTLARRGLKRAENLRDRKLGSEAQLDEAKRQFESQSLSVINRELAVAQHEARRKQLAANVARAQLDFDRSRIVAPFAGRVVSLSVAAGDRVVPGQLVTEVFNPEDLEVRAQVPNRLLTTVRDALSGQSGLAAELVLDGQRYPAELIRLSAVSAAGSGGVDAFFRIPNTAAGELQRGRTVDIDVALPTIGKTFVLPFEALFSLNKAYRVDEGRLVPVEVERVGDARAANGERQMLVRSPALKAGDQVLVTQLPNAASGLRVNVVAEVGNAGDVEAAPE